MNRLILILILLLGTTVFTACSEDPVSTTNTTPGKLLIQPTSLNGVLYQEYTFKAKVENVPFGDIKFLWDFGDGNFRNFSSQEVLFKFNITGSFFVRVKAYDYFTDELLGFDSIPVTITRGSPKVEIIPSSIDSVISYYDDASFQIPISLSVSSEADPLKSRIVWRFGDGTKSDTIATSFSVYHVFPKLGTYSVIADVYGENWAYIGSDTAQIALRMPAINMSMLQSASNVSVMLLVDRTSSFYNLPGLYNPCAYGTNLTNTTERTVSWSSNKVNITEALDSTGSFGASLKDRKLSIDFSSDLKSITNLTVSIHDSTRFSDGSKHDYAEFSYSLKNIQLIAITSNEIVFRATLPTTTALASDLKYNSTPPNTSQVGSFANPASYIYPASSDPDFSQAVIVFTR